MAWRRGVAIVAFALSACGRSHFDELVDAPRCIDTYEPNQTWIGSPIPGTFSGAALDESLTASLADADPDWFAAPYADPGNFDLTPVVVLEPGGDAMFELCTYFECANANVVEPLSCTGTPAGGPGGLNGCCALAPKPQISIANPNCRPGQPFIQGSNSGTLHISVLRADPTNGCTPYTLRWGDS